MGPFKKYVHSEGGMGYSKSVRKFKREERSSVFAQKKQCVYCNSFVRQNSSVQCSLNCEFGTYDVTNYIFIFFNVNKVAQHVHYTCILFWNRVFSLPLWASTGSSKSIHTPIFFLSRIFTSLLLIFIFHFFIEKVKTVAPWKVDSLVKHTYLKHTCSTYYCFSFDSTKISAYQLHAFWDYKYSRVILMDSL